MWGDDDVPSQAGRVAVVTGASAGIGFATARALAERGCHVVLAVRDLARGADAAARIGGSTAVVRLDLAALDSVRAAAAELTGTHPKIDLLINNAGAWSATRAETRDGFELQLGVNHLGHFAFTGLLMGALLATPGSRIVTVSSVSHRGGAMDMADLQMRQNYRHTAAYARSKLADLLFAFELHRLLARADAATASLAAHPGGVWTGLFRGANPALLVHTLGRLVTQSPERGALATLRAATDPEASGGEYYGPSGIGELKGAPKTVRANAKAHDQALARQLWDESERLTGVAYGPTLRPS
ncbi:oxidoreductase [Phytohabitans aurantiacus]|uniref:Short-chain dehydrogenase n=1 Tax=Phytohabitans aurantiacus TaxID=3016789 RepID=A0ABQ5QX31_9ACTN|nr:oxidoreductase [Phytohabitans aurantiacus]GLH98211.1 short-chain dehydrogenase [Phytohabitans aurantiacus]